MHIIDIFTCVSMFYTGEQSASRGLVSYYLVIDVCLLCICSVGLNSSNNKVVYQLTLLQYILAQYYYLYIFYLQPMMNGLAMLQASISISEACFYVGILI